MIETEIKDLKNNIQFNRIYRKWLKRRSRNKDKLTLETARTEALREFYALVEQIQMFHPDPIFTQYKNDDDKQTVKINKHQMTRIFFNPSEHRFMTLKEMTEWKQTDPLYTHFMGIFRKDHKKKGRRTINLWKD